MKILQIIPYFHPAYRFGGSLRVAYDISRELTRRGHQVVVYTSDANSYTSRLRTIAEDINGIKVYRFRNLSMSLAKYTNLFVTLNLAELIKYEIKKFDLIHLHEYRSYQNIVASRYAVKYKIPYVLSAHGSLSNEEIKKGRKWFFDIIFGYKLLKNASKVIALSKIEVKQYREIGVPNNKITTIPNGIDLLNYKMLPEKGFLREKYNLKNEKIILYLGRINQNKGIGLIIKALANLVYNLGQENVKLIIAGPDEGFLKEAKSLVTSLRLKDKVIFTGFLSEKDKIRAYVDADIVVYPEKLNVFGMVPLEAALCSKSVIVAGKNAISDFVQEGDFGYILKLNDATSLSNLLNYALKNEKLTEEKGKKGLKYVSKNFDLKNIVSKIEKLYIKVINSQK